MIPARTRCSKRSSEDNRNLSISSGNFFKYDSSGSQNANILNLQRKIGNQNFGNLLKSRDKVNRQVFIDELENMDALSVGDSENDPILNPYGDVKYSVPGNYADVLLVPVDGGTSYKVKFQIYVSLELNLIDDIDEFEIKNAIEQALLESTEPERGYIINGMPVEVFWDLVWVEKGAVERGDSLGINIVSLQLIADYHKPLVSGFFDPEGKVKRIYIPQARTRCYITGDCDDSVVSSGGGTISHEMGHGLGLLHTLDITSIMFEGHESNNFTSEDIRKMILKIITAQSSDPELIPEWIRG